MYKFCLQSYYQVKFDTKTNGGVGGLNVPLQIKRGLTIQLNEQQASRPGWEFVGWSETKVEENAINLADYLGDSHVKVLFDEADKKTVTKYPINVVLKNYDINKRVLVVYTEDNWETKQYKCLYKNWRRFKIMWCNLFNR